MNRRQFNRTVLSSVASYALLESLTFGLLQGQSLPGPLTTWLQSLQTMSEDLKQGGIRPEQWQVQVEDLFRRLSLEELIEKIDFSQVQRTLRLPDRGVSTQVVRLPTLVGLPDEWAFYSKIFGMKKDRSVIPHGHRNMASCHYVLQGEVHLRQYEKLEEDATHMLIEKTVDERGIAGSYSSISDERNNIHWLKSLTETAYTFDVIVLDIRNQAYDIDNIDPLQGSVETKGMRVPKITVAEGLNRYGYDLHH